MSLNSVIQEMYNKYGDDALGGSYDSLNKIYSGKKNGENGNNLEIEHIIPQKTLIKCGISTGKGPAVILTHNAHRKTHTWGSKLAIIQELYKEQIRIDNWEGLEKIFKRCLEANTIHLEKDPLFNPYIKQGLEQAKVYFYDKIFAETKSFFEDINNKKKQKSKELKDNATQKDKILREIEKIIDSIKDKDSISKDINTKFYELIEAFKQIKYSEDNDKYWEKLQAYEKKYKEIRTKLFNLFEEKNKNNFKAKSAIVYDLKNFVDSLSLIEKIDWVHSNNTIKSYSEKWKQVGFTGKDNEDRLYLQFKTHLNNFNKIRQKYFDKMDSTRELNEKAKYELIERVKGLSNLPVVEPLRAVEIIKEVQAKWKTVGHAGKKDKELWEIFKDACNYSFERLRILRQKEYEAKKKAQSEEWRQKMENILSKQRDYYEKLSNSIENTKAFISSLKSKKDNIRNGPKAYEIRSSLEAKIRSVEDSLSKSKGKLDEVYNSISDLKSKLGKY